MRTSEHVHREDVLRRAAVLVPRATDVRKRALALLGREPAPLGIETIEQAGQIVTVLSAACVDAIDGDHPAIVLHAIGAMVCELAQLAADVHAAMLEMQGARCTSSMTVVTMLRDVDTVDCLFDTVAAAASGVGLASLELVTPSSMGDHFDAHRDDPPRDSIVEPVFADGALQTYLRAERSVPRPLDHAMDADVVRTIAAACGRAIERLALRGRLSAEASAVRTLTEETTRIMTPRPEGIASDWWETTESGSAATDRDAETLAAIATLTPRQREILDHILQGASNPEIAERLGVASGTVKSHIKPLLRRLRVVNRSQAIGLCHGLELPPSRTSAGTSRNAAARRAAPLNTRLTRNDQGRYA